MLATNELECIQVELIAYTVDEDNTATTVNAADEQAGQWEHKGIMFGE